METVSIKNIKPNPNNPRLIKDDKFEKLCKSIKEFPQMMELRPIIVDETFTILGGNMRYNALKHLGYKEIPDEWVKQSNELTEAQKQEFIVKDNVGFGEWDWDILANEWDSEKLEEWGLELPNYSKGLSINTELTEDDLDLAEEFDPVGISKGLTKLVVIFDSIIIAKEWIKKNNLELDYKKKGNDANIILQVNMSSNYGI